MNMYESIKNNLKEAYEAGVNINKLKSSTQQFIDALNDLTNKYITKDVKQALYKIVSKEDSGEKTGFTPSLDYFKCSDWDALPINEIETFVLDTGDKLYLYGPIAIEYTGGKPDIGGACYISIARRLQDIIGIPERYLPKGTITFSSLDDGVSLMAELDSNPPRPIIYNVVAMLAKKQEILSAYKNWCKRVSDSALKTSAEIGQARHDDIANKQRDLANKLDY